MFGWEIELKMTALKHTHESKAGKNQSNTGRLHQLVLGDFTCR